MYTYWSHKMSMKYCISSGHGMSWAWHERLARGKLSAKQSDPTSSDENQGEFSHLYPLGFLLWKDWNAKPGADRNIPML